MAPKVQKSNYQTTLKTGVILATIAAAFSSIIAFANEQTSKQDLSVQDQIVRQFRSLDLSFTGERYHDEKFSYRLLTPSVLEKDAKYALLLWFHGAGESGRDNRKHLVHIDSGLANLLRNHGSISTFVLAPQVPSLETGWFSSEPNDDMLAVAWAMVEQTIQQYPIDQDRIVVAGVSSGGSACWEMAMRHPGRFAAMAPIASPGGDEMRASKLLGTPVWAVNNMYDKQASIDEARRMVSAVRATGGRAKLTEIPNVGHAAWVQALYQNCDLLDWLLAQRRGEPFWSNYFQFVDWQTIGLQCGLPVSAVIILVCWIFRRYFASGKVDRLDSASLDSSAPDPL